MLIYAYKNAGLFNLVLLGLYILCMVLEKVLEFDFDKWAKNPDYNWPIFHVTTDNLATRPTKI